METVLITQARTGSTRLPNKVLLKIGEKELLKIHLERLSRAKHIDKIIVATTNSSDDDTIEKLCFDWNIECFRGSEHDVLDRFYNAAKTKEPKWVVRVTSDCPLIDSDMIDAVIYLAKLNDVDYAANILEERFPDGQDVEVFKFAALQDAWLNAKLNSEREHVTPYIRNNSTFKGKNKFTSVNLPCFADFSKIRMTVDEPKDFELMTTIVNNNGISLTWLSYTNYILEKGLQEINKDIIRNEGLLKSIKND